MFDPQKLKFDHYPQRYIANPPAELQPTLAPWQTQTTPTANTDLRLIFVYDLTAMKAAIDQVAQDHQLSAAGYLYLAYPKLASKKYSGIHRDDLFPFLHVDDTTGEVGQTGLKFSRMVSFDGDFTVVGLKWLKSAPRSRDSADQRVATYQDQVANLQTRLTASDPQVGQLFAALTPGYQRDWTRYVYSPKTTATQDKHFALCQDALRQGFRNLTQYQQAQRRR
ncbi:YdeI/OmpD-associated family protein [Lapidilactobacillus salsurivasis]